jgi:hypothetical protein
MGNKNLKNSEQSSKSSIQISDFVEGQKLLRDISIFLIPHKNVDKLNHNNNLFEQTFNFRPSNNSFSINSPSIIPLSNLLTSSLLTCLNLQENNVGFYKSVFIPFIYENDSNLEEETKFTSGLNEVLGEWNKHIPKYDTMLDLIIKSIEFKENLINFKLPNFIRFALKNKVKKPTIQRKNLRRKTIKGHTILRRIATKKKKKQHKKTSNRSKSNEDSENVCSSEQILTESKENISITKEYEKKLDNDVISKKNLSKTTIKKYNEPKSTNLLKDYNGLTKNKSKKQILLKKNCLDNIIKRNQSFNKASFSQIKKVNSSFGKIKEPTLEKLKPFVTTLKNKDSFKKSGQITPTSKNKQEISKKGYKPHTLVIDIRQLENEDKVLFNFQNFCSKNDFYKQNTETTKKPMIDYKLESHNSKFNINTLLNTNNNHHNIQNITFFNKLRENTKILQQQNLKYNDIDSNKHKNFDKHRSVALRLLNLSPNKDVDKEKVHRANTINNKQYLNKIMSSLQIDKSIMMNNKFSTQNISENNPNLGEIKEKKIKKNEENLSNLLII